MIFAKAAALLVLYAQAHALLVDSSPANNAVLVKAPSQATLHFNARIEKGVSRAELIADDGHRYTLTRMSSDADQADRLVLALPSLASGSYRLEYRVLASDGHATPGQVRFRVAEARHP